jgi:hypothetical protein
MSGPQSQVGRCGEEISLLPLSGVEPGIHGRCSLVVMQTEMLLSYSTLKWTRVLFDVHEAYLNWNIGTVRLRTKGHGVCILRYKFAKACYLEFQLSL